MNEQCNSGIHFAGQLEHLANQDPGDHVVIVLTSGFPDFTTSFHSQEHFNAFWSEVESLKLQMSELVQQYRETSDPSVPQLKKWLNDLVQLSDKWGEYRIPPDLCLRRTEVEDMLSHSTF